MSWDVIFKSICDGFTAAGTVGTVFVALYLSNKDNKPNLSVSATVGVVTPPLKEYLWLSCVNTGKQAIVCTGFSFLIIFSKDWYRFFSRKSRIGLTPIHPIRSLSNTFPCKLLFSERAEGWFDLGDAYAPYLSNWKVIAKFQLKYLWKVAAHTNIKTFKARLSESLIEKMLSIKFSEKQDSVDSSETVV